MWFRNSLTSPQIEALTLYATACASKGLTWIEQLKKDLKRGRSSFVTADQFGKIFDARMAVGPRMLSGPKFDVGDGVSIYESGVGCVPGTVRKISSSDYVTVTFDKIHRSGRHVLYEPSVDEDYHVFTPRADGSYQMIGTKGGLVSLQLGRLARLIRSPSQDERGSRSRND